MGIIAYPWRNAAVPTPAANQAATAADRTRIYAALSRLHLASELIDQAGRGLTPYVAPASSAALLELSLELERIELLMARRTLGDSEAGAGQYHRQPPPA